MSPNFTCVYFSQRGRLSVQELNNAKFTPEQSDDPTYIQGWCDRISAPKTLLVSRVISVHESFEEANKAFEEFSKELEAEGFEFSVPEPTRLSSPDTFDICFTGFASADKDSLTALAKSNNMIVRKSVTKHLDMLCYGYNAGPVKLAQALEQGVIILNKDQFEIFLESGEIPEDVREDIVDQAQKVLDRRFS